MNPTIARITARGLLGRRRFLLFVPLPVILLAVTALARASKVHPAHWGQAVIVGLGFGVVLPLISLIVGTAVIGAEIDDGTVTHILAKPIPRWQIVVTKLIVASAVSAASAAVPMFVVGVMVSGVRLGWALALGSAVGAIAYSAIFLALSIVSRRPVLIGLLYVLIWEGLLGNLLKGTRVLSVEQYGVSLAAHAGDTTILRGTVSVPLAVVMSVLFLVAGVVLATDRLRSFRVAGETG